MAFLKVICYVINLHIIVIVGDDVFTEGDNL